MLKETGIRMNTNHLRGRWRWIGALLLAISVRGDSSIAQDWRDAAIERDAGERARSAYEFVNSIGVNLHLNYFDTGYGNFSFVERELESVGILHVRDGVHLQNTDYNHALYGRWRALGKKGVRFDAVVDPRSRLGDVNARLLSGVDQLARNSIEAFEGPNELDVSNLPDWASRDRNFQESIYASARAMSGAQDVKVIGPSMALAANGRQIGDMSDRIDEGNLHPYPAGKMPSMVFPEQTDLSRAMSGDKPVVITETGYHNALNDHSDQPAVSEAAAAKYIPRLFLEDYLHGIERTYLYEFLDEKEDARLNHFQSHWGLIRADGSEKPAFGAMKNLIGELSDEQELAHPGQLAWRLSREPAQTHHLLLEKADGEFDLILWQEVASYDTIKQRDIANAPVDAVLSLGRKARRVTVYEPAVGADALSTLTEVSKVPVQIPDHPLVVKIVF
jgi:hypothetical protein